MSWKGRLLALASGIIVAIALFGGVHGFLALSDPTVAKVLVVEGWMPDYAVYESLQGFRTNSYTRIVAAGGPLKAGYDLDPTDTYAHMVAARLRKFGLSQDVIQIVPAPGGRRDRTYAAAVALRDWSACTGAPLTAINVLTLGVHARRTRLLYRRAFGGSVDVGVIAIEDREYNPQAWWRYSEGVKEVLSEGVAYLYAKFLFHPDD